MFSLILTNKNDQIFNGIAIKATKIKVASIKLGI